MLDFVDISVSNKKEFFYVRPNFISYGVKDIMFRGGDFYAIYDDSTGFWVTDFQKACEMIDNELFRITFNEKHYSMSSTVIYVIREFNSESLTSFRKYCKSMADNYVELDTNLYFDNDHITRESYATKTLPYSLHEGDYSAYDGLISVLYSPEEREKIEWAIGSVINGDSKKIQKFYVFYGAPGTGKSTVLDIISDMFKGYVSSFDSKALARGSDFALESLKTNPLIAIEHEGNFKQIEDNRKINAIVSHDSIVVNEKYKSQYSLKFRTTLFIGTNEPVRITDVNSGIIRRMIVIKPTGNKVDKTRYLELIQKIRYELGAIAYHCSEVYNSLGPNYYDNYVPTEMIETTNHFYNFVIDNLPLLSDPEGVALSTAWNRYKIYCEDANIPFPMQKMVFKHEMKSYFEKMIEPHSGKSYTYMGLRLDKLRSSVKKPEPIEIGVSTWLVFDSNESILDDVLAECPAQYSTEDGKPMTKWDKCVTKLKDILTTKLHYVKPPGNMIVIDFDLKDKDENKSLELNLEAASRWPQTYAELSKSGAGIHLHYWYTGDASQLCRIIDDNIEVKVFVGNASLRRMVTMCNTMDISTLSSGLPKKGVRKKMLDENTIKSEKHLRALISKSLRKENLGYTKPEIDFIQFLLDKAYDSGMTYDVSDMRPAIQEFALSSTNQAEYCYQTVDSMKFQSDTLPENISEEDYLESFDEREYTSLPGPKLGGDNILIFDIESYPNLLLVCWKAKGVDYEPVRLYNPTPEQVEELFSFKLAGYNNLNYDNIILYLRMLGYSIEDCNKYSQMIIYGDKEDALISMAFVTARKLSYTDVYDFLSAGHKMSLKKWEIKLKMKHMEMDADWTLPLPKDKWEECGDYCCNDVLATEAVWNAVEESDWKARQILADLSGLTVNNTTNQHTAQIILGDDRNAAAQFIYTDLSTIFPGYRFNKYGFPKEEYEPGAKIVKRKSWYMGQDPGEGGRVYAEPGIYYNVSVKDVASMHPHSALALMIFGEVYTARFKELIDARVYIKNGDYEAAGKLFDGKLKKYLTDPDSAAALADALKTAINSVYGLTYKKGSRFYDPRNEDNIVAKYGALFMMNLEKEVKDRGFTVVHIKTDSIKIANATPEILKFVDDYGAKYGFEFDHESVYRKMCLVNESTYIALYEDPDICMQQFGYIPKNNKKHGNEWTATGLQFQVPYVFKTLFSGEPLEHEDFCETKSVTTSMYLDFNEEKPDVSKQEKEKAKLLKKKEKGEDIDNLLLEKLDEEIADGHYYRFIGRVGSFCPIKPGCGGGILLRYDPENKKYNAVTGTKKSKIFDPNEEPVWRWMEEEMVSTLDLWDNIDKRYFETLANDAIETIEKYGDFEMFRDPNAMPDVTPEWMNVPVTDKEELPFD